MLQTLNLQSVGVWYGLSVCTLPLLDFTFRQSKNLSIIAMKSLVSLVVSWCMYVMQWQLYHLEPTSSQRWLHYTTLQTSNNFGYTKLLKYTIQQYTALLNSTLQNYTTLHSTIHSTTLNNTTLQFRTLHYLYTTVNDTTLQFSVLYMYVNPLATDSLSI